MKFLRSWIPSLLGVFTGIWYAAQEPLVWWECIIAILIAIACFYWTAQLCSKVWMMVAVLALGMLVIRFIAIPFILFCIEVVIWVISAAISVIGWGFGTLGLIGGVILLIIVLLFLKGLFS